MKNIERLMQMSAYQLSTFIDLFDGCGYCNYATEQGCKKAVVNGRTPKHYCIEGIAKWMESEETN